MSEKGWNSLPWNPLLSRKADKRKSLDTEGKQNHVNFLNISQHLHSNYKLKFLQLPKHLTLRFFVFANCFVVCELQRWKEGMENGQWRCFFFHIFVLLFGYSFITETSFKNEKRVYVCWARKKLKPVCLFRSCWGLKQAPTGGNAVKKPHFLPGSTAWRLRLLYEDINNR